MEEDKSTTKGIAQIIESAVISVAASFPIAASLATGWNEYKNYRQVENIKSIIADYFKKLDELKDSVDTEYLKTENAKTLLERTVIIGKEETRKEKREMLAEFLANASTKKLSPDAEKDMVLDTIDRISPFQCQLLVTITASLVLGWGRANVKLGSDYNPDAEDKPTFGYIIESGLVALEAKNSKADVEAGLDYMQSIGVLETHSQRGWSTIGGKMGVRGYRPTKLGLKVLEYLSVDIENMEEKKK